MAFCIKFVLWKGPKIPENPDSFSLVLPYLNQLLLQPKKEGNFFWQSLWWICADSLLLMCTSPDVSLSSSITIISNFLPNIDVRLAVYNFQPFPACFFTFRLDPLFSSLWYLPINKRLPKIINNSTIGFFNLSHYPWVNLLSF